MNELPKICQKSSIRVEVKKGEKYTWCACGLSSKQPFCDGSHSCSALTPMIYTAEKDGVIGFCGCKYTKKPPLCDGSHKFLPDTND